MLKQLSVSELLPGMMVTQVLEQHGPVKIRKVGFIRSADMIRGLTEMGVTRVEVDINQSLNVEPQDDNNESVGKDNSANEPVVAKQTATQRLVASNKQIADVDRHLSQQFHRSLFLPAVDQMPSKWLLYGKPYALLTGFILFGLFLGIIVSYGVVDFLRSSDAPAERVVSQNTDSPDQMSTSSPVVTNNELATTSQESSPVIETSPVELPTKTQTPEKTAQLPVESEEEIAVKDEPKVEEVLAKQESAPKKAVNKPAPKKREAKKVEASVNGIALQLEEGQRVLGYQGDAEEPSRLADANNKQGKNDSLVQSDRTTDALLSNANTDQRSTNRETPSQTLNPDLLRRIQAAAQDLDSRANEVKPEILKVTDLNELPRIDQLSPAILTQMPAMSFSAHMYASNPRDRWVRVNSQRLGEGEVIANDVVLKRIEAEKVVLEYKGQEFTMNALSDW
jgi:general secretion pathway protein B